MRSHRSRSSLSGLNLPYTFATIATSRCPSLPRDQLEGRTGARHAHRPVVAGIVEMEASEPQRPQALTVGIPRYPSVHPAKDALTGQHAREVRL
jgi:hypothetical protein